MEKQIGRELLSHHQPDVSPEFPRNKGRNKTVFLAPFIFHYHNNLGCVFHLYLTLCVCVCSTISCAALLLSLLMNAKFEKACAHIHRYTLQISHTDPQPFLLPIYSSIHPILYLFYTLLPNANRFVCSPLNCGSSMGPRLRVPVCARGTLCMFVRVCMRHGE